MSTTEKLRRIFPEDDDDDDDDDDDPLCRRRTYTYTSAHDANVPNAMKRTVAEKRDDDVAGDAMIPLIARGGL